MPDDRNGREGGPRRREVTDLYATVLEVVKRYHGAAPFNSATRNVLPQVRGQA